MRSHNIKCPRDRWRGPGAWHRRNELPMQLDRTAAADVADLLGMQFKDVRKAVAALRDDGEMDPENTAPVTHHRPDDLDLSAINLAKNRRARLLAAREDKS